MKKMTAILTVMALLLVNAGHAQNNSGKGAAAGSNAANNDFAWLIGLGGVAVLGVVVGVTAAAATSNPTSFSH